MKLPSSATVCWLILMSAGLALAEEAELVTDRPDFTESAVVVPRGSVQLESGLTWTDDGELVTVAGIEALVRWGFARNLELRLGLPDYTDVRKGPERTGWEDSSLGLKWQLGPVSSWDLALIAEVSLPTGADHRTSDAIDPTLILIAGTELGAGWGMGAQVGASRATTDGERMSSFAGTLVFGVGVGEHAGTFFEVKAEKEEDVDTSVILHHGWTYLLRRTLQLDAHLGVGVTDSAPDWLIGAGLSVRF